MWFRIWLFCLSLLLPATAWTQSATVSAYPNPCALANSGDNCTSTITWSSGNAPSAGLFWGSVLVGGAPSGTYTPSWININGYTFDVRQDYNNPNSQVLASVFVLGEVPPQPTGNVLASPSPCTIAAGNLSCTSSIMWSSSNAPTAGLFFGSVLVGGTTSGTYTPSWITTAGNTFDLRADYNNPYSQILASTFVYGVAIPEPSATISATPNPCILATSGALCSSTIGWRSTDAPNGGLFLGSNLVGNAIAGSYAANATGTNVQTFYVKLDRNNANSQVLASVDVIGTVAPPPGNLQKQCSTDGSNATFSWNPVVGANAYVVRLNYVPNDAPACVGGWYCDGQDTMGADQTATTFTSTIVPGQQYNFWTHAKINGSYGNASSIAFTCNAPPPITGGNLISNGGFESPVTSSYVYYPTIPGWINSGGVAVQRNGSAWAAAAAPEGVQTAVLQNIASLTTTVGAPSAATYSLAFKAAARQYGGHQTLNVAVNGTSIYSVTPSSLGFTQYQTTLNLSAGTQTITISGTNNVGDNSAFIDDVVLTSTVSPTVQPITVGAVRWDYGWGTFGGMSTAGANTAWDYQFNIVEYGNRLNTKWISRWPFFVNTNANAVHPIANSQMSMDSEISYANSAGLTYWAFLYYGVAGSGADSGLDLYESSTLSTKPKFALILEWRPSIDLPANRDNIVGKMRSPTYFKLANGRPLLYLSSGEPNTVWDTAGAKAHLDDIISRYSAANGGVMPAVVYLSYRTTRPSLLAPDACGTYATTDYVPYGSNADAAAAPALGYVSLVSSANAHRDSWVGCNPIATVMSGWDPSPRWVGFPSGYGGFNPGNPPGPRYLPPTAKQLNNHMYDALQWANSQPGSSLRTVLIYAWNEMDEGGWIVPTYGGTTGAPNAICTPPNCAPPNKERLDAIGRAISGARDQ